MRLADRDQLVLDTAPLLAPSEYRRLKEFNSNHGADGRFTSGDGGVDWSKAAADVAAHGGGTFDPRTGESPKPGYQVAQTGATTQHPEAMLSDPKAIASAILDFRQANAAAFNADPTLKVGVWVQGGKVWMEPSENIGDRDRAVQAGRDRDQIAIWDNAAGKEIPTGGSGGL